MLLLSIYLHYSCMIVLFHSVIRISHIMLQYLKEYLFSTTTTLSPPHLLPLISASNGTASEERERHWRSYWSPEAHTERVSCLSHYFSILLTGLQVFGNEIRQWKLFEWDLSTFQSNMWMEIYMGTLSFRQRIHGH